MTEYHVGCGAFAIYAGTLNKKGDMWLHKSEVTHEAMDAVAGHLVMHDEQMRFTYKGERYVLKVEKLKEGDEDDCISRQDAIDTAVTIARRMLLDPKPMDVKMSSDYLVENLFKPMRKLPSVQHERAGKWVRKTFEDWWCNQCGIEVCTETPEDYNFCPNCGADMRKEDNHE